MKKSKHDLLTGLLTAVIILILLILLLTLVPVPLKSKVFLQGIGVAFCALPVLKTKQPKFRRNQVVMLLDHNVVVAGAPLPKPSDPEYRRDTGKFATVTKVIPEFWEFRDQVQYSYEIEPGYEGSFGKVHESWLRALTGEEITGRI